MVQVQSHLLLHDGLARVEGDRLRRRLARILVELRSRQPKRVLRLRLAHAITNERKRGVRAQQVLQLAVGKVAVRFAVLAIALGMEMREGCDAAERPGLAAELRRLAPRAVAAHHQAGFPGRYRRTV